MVGIEAGHVGIEVGHFHGHVLVWVLILVLAHVGVIGIVEIGVCVLRVMVAVEI